MTANAISKDTENESAPDPLRVPDPIPAPIQALLALFEGELAAVKFPDVDREILGKDAARVREAASEVARAEAALEDARRAHLESMDILVQRCQRALAYARVFAEGNPAVAAKLEALSPPGRSARRPRVEAPAAAPAGEAQESAEPPAPKRRGRAAKAPEAGAEA